MIVYLETVLFEVDKGFIKSLFQFLICNKQLFIANAMKEEEAKSNGAAAAKKKKKS